MAVPFDTDLNVTYGAVDQVSPLIRRVVANNPSKFTFKGTGTYLVGQGEVAVVDPGPADDEHVEALLRALDGERVTAILITHTHRDHSPAAAQLKAAFDAPAYGYGPHPAAADQSVADDMGDDGAEGEPDPEAEEKSGDTDFVPDQVCGHGAMVSGPGWTFEALHTPGHISNHLCWALAEERALFTGDHVMGWSTTIVPPPDGNMADYLASLRLLLDRPGDEVYWPTHGPPIREPRAYTAALLEHRLERERQIVEQLTAGPRTIAEMVAVLYADVREELHKPAARSMLAHLIHLVANGQVTTDDDPGAESMYRLA